MDFPPRAYLVGAAKAGTTSLAHLLDQHPAVRLSDPKEPDFFTGNHGRGAAWYRACFEGATPGQVLLDASQSYAVAPLTPDGGPMDGVPGRIHAARPDARILYLMRDPVERAWSSYWHAVRAGEERRPLRQAVTEASPHVRGGLYAFQLSRYLDVFPPDAILVLTFDGFRKAPRAAAERALAFLGVPDPVLPRDLDRPRNASFVYTGAGAVMQRALGGAGPMKAASGLVKRMMPRPAVEAVKRLITKPVPRMTPADRAFLAAFFQDDQARLPDVLAQVQRNQAA